MNDTAQDMLNAWDALAADFEFSGFNNMNYDSADSRLHLFRDDSKWALIIEELVDWPSADGIMGLSFCLGPGVRAEQGLGPVLYPVVAEFGEDDDGEPVLPQDILLQGENITVPVDQLVAHAEEHEVSEALSLLVWLSEKNRPSLFRTTAELSELVVDGLPQIMQLEDWCHPDVYLESKVSHSETFQQLAEVLASGDISKYKPTESPNSRDWKKWMDK